MAITSGKSFNKHGFSISSASQTGEGRRTARLLGAHALQLRVQTCSSHADVEMPPQPPGGVTHGPHVVLRKTSSMYDKRHRHAGSVPAIGCYAVMCLLVCMDVIQRSCYRSNPRR